VIALTPDSSGLIGGAERLQRNVLNAGEHLLWLRARSADPRDVLFGRVDRLRLALAGHSAGGGVALEAAIESQTTAFPVTGLALLDAVAFPGTDQRAASMRSLALASLRSEPSFCNARGRILGLLARLPFPALDIRVVGGTHCDPENPSSALCGLFCGESTPARQGLYQRLLLLFFRDVFRMPPGTEGVGGFLEELARLERAGAIARRPIGSTVDSGRPGPGDAAPGALPGQ
jgi:pimeloyl-ACP methyl ester carboxylesterase